LRSDKTRIQSILEKNAPFTFLATCEGNAPRLRPMAAIVAPDLAVRLVTYRSSAKVAELRVNPRLALAFVEPPAGDTAATVYGRASFVDDDAEKSRVCRLSPYDLTRHFPEGPGSAEFCLLKVEIESIEWWDRWEDGRRVYRPPAAFPLPGGEPNGRADP